MFQQITGNFELVIIGGGAEGDIGGDSQGGFGSHAKRTIGAVSPCLGGFQFLIARHGGPMDCYNTCISR